MRKLMSALSVVALLLASCGDPHPPPIEVDADVRGNPTEGRQRAGVHPETGRIQNTNLLPEHITEASTAAEQHLYQVMGRSRDDVRENYRMSERNVTFWRGNVTYRYYDEEEGLGISVLFQDPMELYVGDRRYLSAVHPDTGSLITLELGIYDEEEGYTEWTNYPDTFAFSTQEDPFDGQLSLGEITDFGQNGIELADIYAICLRGDQERVYPQAHIWDSNHSSSEDRDEEYGTYSEHLVYGVNDDKIYRDLNAVLELVNESSQCLS